MSRHFHIRSALMTAMLLGSGLLGSSVYAQQGSGALGGLGGGTSDSAASGGQAGFTGTSGFGLSDRFSGGMDRFMTGSSAIGTTTAGANAASGLFSQGNTGSGGFGGVGGIGGISGLGGVGGLGGIGGIGGLGGFALGRGGAFGQGGQMQQGNTDSQRQIRTGLVIAIDPVPGMRAPSPTISPMVEASVARSVLTLQARGLDVTAVIEGRTVVLEGTVATNYERLLAERLAQLEPGIEAVQNDIEVRED